MSFPQLLQAIPHTFSPEEEQLLEKAFMFAEKSHAGQTRKSGENYMIHLINAAIILGKIFPDVTSLSAMLLHDVPEDTGVSMEELKSTFGEEVANLVDGVTKLGQVRLGYSHQPQYLENLRKLFVATSRDVRVMLLKLADRLHNMRTIQHLPKDKQGRIAQETLEVYAPIAARLGIGTWQGELEDLAFAIVHPEEFIHTKQIHEKLLSAHQQKFESIKERITKALQAMAVGYIAISGRTKRVYSLHKKLQKPSYKDAEHKVADAIAFRIITSSVSECYAALGAVHQSFQPVPGTFDDYIRLPKPSGYQSLHTTVLDETGGQFEIQIRTDLMHEQAERGVAAHWFYTQSGKQSKKINTDDSWAHELRAWQEHEGSPEELLENLKLDLFSDRIFVLTPKGDCLNLPVGATPIDFAFGVHTELGYYMTGSKVNGNIASIYSELKQGDIVEILKSKNPVKMSPDWLASAHTSNARSHIRQYLKGQNKII